MFTKKRAKLLIAAAMALLLTACSGAAHSETFPQTETRTPVVLEQPTPVSPESTETTRVLEDGSAAIYQAAMEYLDQGDEMEACKLLMEIRDYQDSSVILHEIVNRRARENAQTFGYSYRIRKDGTVVLNEVTFCNEDGDYVEAEDPDWTDIVAVVVSYEAGVVGLRGDGTIITNQPDSDAAAIMSQWTDVIAIYDYIGSVLGLRADGTVVSTWPNPKIESWEDIVQLNVNCLNVCGLKKDGTVVSDGAYDEDVSGWTDIVQVATGNSFVAGLRADGTILVSGDEELQQYVSGWTDVVAIDAYSEIMGLRSDGTVVATDRVFGEYMADDGFTMDFSGWTDIVDIDTWGASFVGLRSDGTLMATGLDEGGQLNVGQWQNIKAILVDNYTTFGLQEDGTLLQTVYGGDKIAATNVRMPGE